MAERPPAETIIRELGTTSAKIRAPAEVGYTRSAIAGILGIRYQHAHKVLADAGMTGGRGPRAVVERDVLTVDAATPQAARSWQVLRGAGFRDVDRWTVNPDGKLILEADVPLDPGVYSFAVDEMVAYIGLTTNGLRARLDQYRRGHARQRTNARVNALIRSALSDGHTVAILVATPEPSAWMDCR